MGDRFDNFQVKVYEALKNAIFEAVRESYNVKSLVRIIQDHHMLEELFDYLGVIETRSLMESVVAEEPPENQTPKEDAVVERSIGEVLPDKNQYIDGRKLSLNEILFQEYYLNRFDESTWLRRNKIRL